MPTDVLLSNSLHGCMYLRRCLMPGGLLSAISGILAGGILGFGAAEWFVLLDTFARSCTVVWCFSFVSVQDLEFIGTVAAYPFRAVLSVLLLLVFVFFCFGCVALFWFVCFFGLDKTSGCVTVRTPLSTPQGGT